MRYVAIIIIFLSSCRTDIPYTGNAGEAEENLDLCEGKFSKRSVHCLRNFLIDEDGGGTWQQIDTTPQNIRSLLIGDNPCFEWDDKACGLYQLIYIVGDPCCYDTAFVNPLKCCLTGQSICN
jgi:hypothetical protein